MHPINAAVHLKTCFNIKNLLSQSTVFPLWYGLRCSFYFCLLTSNFITMKLCYRTRNQFTLTKWKFGSTSEDWTGDNFISHKVFLSQLPDSWMPGMPDPKLGVRTIFLHWKSIRGTPCVLTFVCQSPQVWPLAVTLPHMLWAWLDELRDAAISFSSLP